MNNCVMVFASIILSPVLFGLSADVRADYTANALDAQHATEDVKLLRRALEEIHPGYDRYTSREALNQLLDALEKRAEDGMTDVELYREVSYLLAKIRCSHTKAELPTAMKEYRESTPTFLPFTFRLFAGRMIVDQVDGTQQNLKRGDEILSINGRAIWEIVPQVEDYLSVDGWTDHAKRVELESSSELLGDAIDHFWPMLYGWPRQWTIESRDDSGRTVISVLTPITYPRWLKLITGGQESYQDFGPDTVEFRVLENKAAYLAIETFVNYRNPVDPVELLKPHFEEMRKRGTKHLVLDLRRCGGGSDDVPEVLTTFLATRPINISRPPSQVRTYRVGDLRKHLHTWDDSAWNLPAELFKDIGNGFYEFRSPDFEESVTITPRGENFAGRLTILSSAHNSSGATNVIAFLRGKRDNVSVVGEPTGGTVEGTTAGLIYFLKLPNSGITVRIPALRNFNGMDEFQPGRGVIPDEHVMPSVNDFLAGRDPALEVALQQP